MLEEATAIVSIAATEFAKQLAPSEEVLACRAILAAPAYALARSCPPEIPRGVVTSALIGPREDRSFGLSADGEFVVAWQSAQGSGPNGAFSIQGQRYSVAAAAPPVPAMSPAARFALGAGLLLLGAAYVLRRPSRL